MKWKVKVGEEFGLEVSSESDSNTESLKNWKSLVVASVFVTVMVFGGVAIATHDFTLYDKFLQAVVSVVKAAAKGSKENVAKPECQSKNH